MMLPKRRKPEKMGIHSDAWMRCQSHLRWIRGFHCSVHGCEGSPIEAAHVQGSDEVPANERGGMGVKAADWWTYPLCHFHHHESHMNGHETFDRRYGINRVEIARRLAAISPHRHKWSER
jgi:hypothetical protein